MIKAAVSMRVVEAPTYHEPRDAISHDWIALLNTWNALPILVPNLIDRPEAFLDSELCDILILTGGESIGESAQRDDLEGRLLRHAISSGIPVFGVCRGLQLIIDHFSGTCQRIEGHVATTHAVIVSPLWQDIYPSGTTVNSFHTLGVAGSTLPDALQPVAHDQDNFVEALHHRELPIVGVMWHPERAGAPSGDRSVFNYLVQKGAFWR